MKQNTKRLLALLLAAFMMFGVFAGCGNNTESKPAEASAASAQEQTPDEKPVETTTAPEAPGSAEEDSALEGPAEAAGLVEVPLPLEDEAVHYSCWMPVAPYVGEFMNLDEFSEKVAIVKMINEATNVHIDFNAVAGGMVEEEAFNLMIAANDYTDIIGVMNYYGGANAGSSGHQKAIDDEVIIDIKDDLKEYAPNYWNYLTSDDDAYMTMLTPDGQMGCIAQLIEGSESMGMIIRKDWYEESGVPALDTLDQFEEYLTYCKDTYGAYSYLMYTGLDTDFSASFNVNAGGLSLIDGKLIHAYEQPAFRDYLTKMNDWYKKGLFHNEFYNDTDVTTVRQDMANDLCSFVDGSASNMGMIFDMNPDNTKMELMGIPYPKADGVDEIHAGNKASIIKNSDTWAVSSACGDHIPLMKLINWLYSEAGQQMYNWGEEHVAFEYDADGNPQWTDLVINNPDGLSFMFASYLYASGTGSVYFPSVYHIEKEFYAANDDIKEAMHTFDNLTDGAYSMPRYVTLNAEETEEYNSMATELETYAEGMLLKFILGDEPMSNYDAFLEQCRSMGLDRMTELYQQAYDRAQEALNA